MDLRGRFLDHRIYSSLPFDLEDHTSQSCCLTWIDPTEGAKSLTEGGRPLEDDKYTVVREALHHFDITVRGRFFHRPAAGVLFNCLCIQWKQWSNLLFRAPLFGYHGQSTLLLRVRNHVVAKEVLTTAHVVILHVNIWF